MLQDEGNALVDGHISGVDVEIAVFGLLVGIGDTSEIGDGAGTGLLVKSLDITALANLQRGGDVALEEGETSILMNFLGGLTGLSVWGDECDEHDNTSHVEKLGYFSDAADVLGSVFRAESETLVEAFTDNITIKDEGLGRITNDLVHVLLESLRECGFTSTGKTSEPVGGAGLGFMGNSGVCHFKIFRVF